jgi:hypothetical protein
MLEYEQLIIELGNLGDEIEERLRPRIEEFIRENNIRDSNDEPVDVGKLLGPIIDGLDYFGERHALYSVWEAHREDFLRIGENHAGEKIAELKDKETELEAQSSKLIRELERRKLDLRTEYGISSEELITEKEEIPRGV